MVCTEKTIRKGRAVTSFFCYFQKPVPHENLKIDIDIKLNPDPHSDMK